MAPSSALVVQLHNSSLTFPAKPNSRLLLLTPKNPNFTLSISLSRTHRPLCSLIGRRISSRATPTIRYDYSATEDDEGDRDSTLRELCQGKIPDHIIRRMDDVGFISPTDVQRKALPILLSGRDCILHAQTGSGKTLAYLLSIFSAVDSQRSAVQALIVVPTRELGMQVTKVARMLAVKRAGLENDQCSVMALLDGGMLKRQRSWLKAEPPTIVVATMGSLNNMIDKHLLKLEALRVLVIDEVDSMFGSSTQVGLLRKLLTSYSSPVSKTRQTILASASIPQHKRFLYDCVQQKWTKADVIHVHVNPVQPMPSQLYHRFMVCRKEERCQILLSLLQADVPRSSIIFVNEQSEKSKKAGNDPVTNVLVEFLSTSSELDAEVLVLEEDMNFNSRAASLSELRQEKNFLLVATDLAARGVDLPETTHIYNFDLPKTAVDYLHRAGRTGRRPFSKERYTVTSFISKEEKFVLQRYENELRFHCAELPSS